MSVITYWANGRQKLWKHMLIKEKMKNEEYSKKEKNWPTHSLPTLAQRQLPEFGGFNLFSNAHFTPLFPLKLAVFILS